MQSSLTTEAIIERIRDAVREIEPQTRAILYGSRARGTAQPDSDWDLLLVTERSANPDERQVLEERFRAIFAETGAVVSPLWVWEQEWISPLSRVSPFHANVKEDGIQLTGPPETSGPVTEEEMAEARDALVQQFLEQAWEAFSDAEYNAEGGRWKTCVNRLYYACFHAASALLLQRGYRFSKHASVHGLFNREYGQTGEMPRELIALYNKLFEGRLDADYAPKVSFSAEEVQPWLPLSRRFIEAIEQLLAASG